MDKPQTSSPQISRIKDMEEILDKTARVFEDLDAALAAFEVASSDLHRLIDYYESPDWKRDFADDAAGKLPVTLKRGVLSEDAVYDLLSDYRRILDTLRELADRQ